MERDKVEPQKAAMDVDGGDPYGFLIEQCIIPSAEENQLRSMPLFSPTPISTQQQQQPSPSPVVKHEQTDDEIDTIMHTPALEIKEKEKQATENMQVDEEESQSVTKEPTTISVENEGFSQKSPPTRDEPPPAAAAADDDDDETPPPLTAGEKLQKTIEVESPALGKSPLEQNQGLVVLPHQTGQTHFVPPRSEPPPAAAAAAAFDDGVGPSSSSSSNPQNPKQGNDDIDILDVLKSKGFYVPRPRWWRPEGYDKP